MNLSSFSYAKALREVRAKVKSSGTSFATGMAALSGERREAMHALYAFCRIVDDIADDSATPEQRAGGLRLWKDRLHDLFKNGRATDSVTTVLLPAVARFDLQEQDFMDIVNGMEMDGPEPVYAPNMDELDRYCDLVASAVGRASVRIFGDSSQAALLVAHHLGRALQLTNILRDLAEDAARGRLYLPREILERHGLLSRGPEALLNDPALAAACFDLAVIARAHFEKADAALEQADRRALKPARLMRDYYRALLEKLVRTGWKKPRKRIRLSFWEKARFALRAFFEGAV